MQAYHVSLAVYDLLSNPFQLQLRYQSQIRLEVIDQHPRSTERRDPPQDPCTDSTRTDDPHGHFGEAATHVSVPAPGMQLEIGDMHRSQQRKHQPEGELGYRRGRRIGGVADLDATSLGSQQIDAVQANPYARNELQTARATHDGVGDGFGTCYDNVKIGNHLRQVVLGQPAPQRIYLVFDSSRLEQLEWQTVAGGKRDRGDQGFRHGGAPPDAMPTPRRA